MSVETQRTIPAFILLEARNRWQRSTHPMSSIRSRIIDAARAPVDGCWAISSNPSLQLDGFAVDPPVAPLIACARHKACAIQVELEALDMHEAETLAQVDASRMAAQEKGHPPDDLDVFASSLASVVTTAAAARRSALQTEAVAADMALENAITAVSALEEVRLHPYPKASMLALTNRPLNSFRPLRSTMMQSWLRPVLVFSSLKRPLVRLSPLSLPAHALQATLLLLPLQTAHQSALLLSGGHFSHYTCTRRIAIPLVRLRLTSTSTLQPAFTVRDRQERSGTLPPVATFQGSLTPSVLAVRPKSKMIL